MDRQAELQSKAATASTNGERAGAWTTYETVWATVRETPAREIIAGNTEQAQKTLILFIYYHSSVTERHRVLFEGDAYDIENIREIGYREGMELRCVRHQG